MNATARKPRLGDHRYLAMWCDAAELKAAAGLGGWLEGSDYSPMDYVDHSDFEYGLSTASFDEAVKIARTKVASDFWGCPRVYLQEFGPGDVPSDAREWEAVKFWDIPAEGEPEEQSV